MNNTKIVTFSPSKLYDGVNTLANAVKTTLGPKGRNVIIQAPYGTPLITKDGVTVAREINLEDIIEDLGVQIVKQAAQKTSVTAGDGTTTSIILAQALINNALPLLSTISPIEVKRTYDALLKESLNLLKSYSYDVTDDDILSIATISANNDPIIGRLIQEAYSFVGREGLVAIEDSTSEKTYVKTTEGASFKSGLASYFFATDEVKQEAIYQDPLILVTSRKLKSTNDLVPIMNKVGPLSRPLVIIADEIESQALSFLVVNRVRGGFPLLVLTAPAFGDRRSELLKDIAILTGAKLITPDDRMEEMTIADLGTCAKITTTKEETLLISPASSPDLNTRVLKIKEDLEHATDDWSKSKLNERLATLAGKVAVLHIGAATEAELKEKKDRIDDALRATKSAIQSGYCTGGGLTYMRVANDLLHWSKQLGPKEAVLAFYNALLEPTEVIKANAGQADTIFAISPVENIGYNALTDKTENLLTAGVIDPTLVLTEALTNAVSVASTLLLTNTTIHNKSQDFYQPTMPQ